MEQEDITLRWLHKLTELRQHRETHKTKPNLRKGMNIKYTRASLYGILSWGR